MFHLRSAINVCETIGTLGTGTAGPFSLKSLGWCEEREFPSLDGVMLRGTYVHRHTRQRRGIVVFCHEFGGDRNAAASYASGLLDEGFDVFSFDFRNHGASDHMEGYLPRTWATRYEVNDVVGAINHLRTSDGDVEGVALMGLSRGGSAAISAASRNEGIWAVITDGAFESRWVTTAYIRRFMPQFVRMAPMLTAVPSFLQELYGTFVHDLVARKFKHPCIKLKRDIRRVRQPLLMIHGERDHTIPVELAHRLWRKLRTSARLWIVPKGNHNRSIRSQPEQYQRRICHFLRTHAPRVGLLEYRDARTASPATIALAAKVPQSPLDSARLDSPVCV
jgi:pimeloyl-ACP methyl ester carboxylesterase